MQILMFVMFVEWFGDMVCFVLVVFDVCELWEIVIVQIVGSVLILMQQIFVCSEEFDDEVEIVCVCYYGMCSV